MNMVGGSEVRANMAEESLADLVEPHGGAVEVEVDSSESIVPCVLPVGLGDAV